MEILAIGKLPTVDWVRDLKDRHCISFGWNFCTGKVRLEPTFIMGDLFQRRLVLKKIRRLTLCNFFTFC